MRIRGDLAITMLGIGSAQAIQLLATPLLARVYSPAQFGVFAVVVAVSGVIATIASLRYDFALAASSETDLAPLAQGALLLPFVVAPVFSMALYLVWLGGLADGLPGGATAFALIGAIATVQGLTAVGAALCTRRGWFGLLSAIRIAQPLVFVTLALLVLDGLTGSFLVGWAAALGVALIAFARDRIRPGWHAMRAALARHWRYPALAAPVALLDVLALAVPLLFIVAAYGEQSGGNYSQVQRLIGAPLTLLGMAMAQIFLKYGGDIVRADQPLSPFIARIVGALIAVSVVLVGAVLVIGEPLMALLLGTGWRTDLLFLMLVLAPAVFRMCVSPVSGTFMLTGQIATGSMWQAGYFVVTLLVLWLATRTLSLEGTLIAFGVSELVMYLIYLALAWRVARRYDRTASASRP